MYIRDIFLETYDEKFLIALLRFATQELSVVMEIDGACSMWSLVVVANKYKNRTQVGESC